MYFLLSFAKGVSDSQPERCRDPEEEAEGRRLVLQEGVRGGAQADSCRGTKGNLKIPKDMGIPRKSMAISREP